MNENHDFNAGFLWGMPEEIRELDSVETPLFRLVNPTGDLPPVASRFMVPPGSRAIVRGGRTVARCWSTVDADYCFIAGLVAPDLNASRGEQAAAIFPELEGVLAEEGMTFANVVRTWLYIDRVCEWYGEFNAARSAFFESRKVFETFLPASTGIGCANLDGAALTAGAIAFKPKRAGVRAEIVESPLQAPAMAYKSSFSRAAEIITPDFKQLFISGTASIKPDSHDVAYVGDIERQIECTMTAVEAILLSRGYNWQDTSRAIVYLKKPEFLEPWRAYLAVKGLPENLAVETVCDVCRDEWLVEIELDAIKGGRAI